MGRNNLILPAKEIKSCHFKSSTGQPMEPQSFSRSFKRLCRQLGLRVIKLHHLRHTTSTLLKDLGVPARDIQLILGHSNVSVTMQVYQHDSMNSRRESLSKLERLLNPTQNEHETRMPAAALPSELPALPSKLPSNQHLTGAMQNPPPAKYRHLTGVPEGLRWDEFYGELVGY